MLEKTGINISDPTSIRNKFANAFAKEKGWVTKRNNPSFDE